MFHQYQNKLPKAIGVSSVALLITNFVLLAHIQSFSGDCLRQSIQIHNPICSKEHTSLWDFNDSETGMLPGIPGSAMCVQRFDDSLNSAIHTTYRISLRSSSLREPRDPLPKVVLYIHTKNVSFKKIKRVCLHVWRLVHGLHCEQHKLTDADSLKQSSSFRQRQYFSPDVDNIRYRL